MNRPALDVGEFEIQDGQYLPDDEIPDSLIQILKHIAIDFIPESRAASVCINDWIDQQEDLVPGTETLRGVGLGSFDVRGVKINALAQPFRFCWSIALLGLGLAGLGFARRKPSSPKNLPR